MIEELEYLDLDLKKFNLEIAKLELDESRLNFQISCLLQKLELLKEGNENGAFSTEPCKSHFLYFGNEGESCVACQTGCYLSIDTFYEDIEKLIKELDFESTSIFNELEGLRARRWIIEDEIRDSGEHSPEPRAQA